MRDACPNTPTGRPVTTNGCATKQSTILQGVNFEFGTARLTSTAKRILERTAEVMKASPEFALDIIGHTDAKGSDIFNLTLPEARANAVAAYLRQLGVSYDRLRTMGRGATDPFTENNTLEGRATNRRVEIRIRDHK